VLDKTRILQSNVILVIGKISITLRLLFTAVFHLTLLQT